MKYHKTPVYVVSRTHKPLMPTYRFGHVRKLLEAGKAVPINNNPFTIRLKYDTPDITQELYGGGDTGRENIGMSASIEDGECVYLSDIRTNNKSIKQNMQDRAEYRRGRRRHDRQNKQRKAVHDNTELQNGDDDVCCTTHPCKAVKMRYPGAENPITHKVIRGKEGKFNNRKRDEDWITPSARQVVQITVSAARRMFDILPITVFDLERVSFDFQKLENQNIHAWEYGKGPLYGFKNYKDYIFAEQHGRCLLCGQPIETYHHITPRKDGRYDHVSNIAGLCCACHQKVHDNSMYEKQLLDLKKGTVQKYQVGLLNSVMPMLIEAMAKLCAERGIKLVITEGKDTAQTREKYGIPKDHCTDAYAISLYGRDVDSANVSLPDKVFLQRRYKKKSKNIISKLGRREYWYNGKCVAVNRHKAMDQKTDSLEEYMAKYAEAHIKLECDQHFHELEIRPAKRVYTYHKLNDKAKTHPGDIVEYTKYNKTTKKKKHYIVVCESARCDDEGGHIEYADGKSFKSIYCKPIGSGCLQYTGSKDTRIVVIEAEREAKKHAKPVKKRLAKAA